MRETFWERLLAKQQLLSKMLLIIVITFFFWQTAWSKQGVCQYAPCILNLCKCYQGQLTIAGPFFEKVACHYLRRQNRFLLLLCGPEKCTLMVVVPNSPLFLLHVYGPHRVSISGVRGCFLIVVTTKLSSSKKVFFRKPD